MSRRIRLGQDDVCQHLVYYHNQGAQEPKQETYEDTVQDGTDPNHKSRA
jgi:hypothetical protein